jgi:hypothetical protein
MKGSSPGTSQQKNKNVVTKSKTKDEVKDEKTLRIYPKGSLGKS